MKIIPKNKYHYTVILLLLLIVTYCTYVDIFKLYENFNISYNNDKNVELKDYENIPINNNKIYENIESLISENKNIKTDDNIIINIINGMSGMGSQLTIFIQTQYYFKEINEKIICLPHFSNNQYGFKYHDTKYNNSFFLYFKKKRRNSKFINL